MEHSYNEALIQRFRDRHKATAPDDCWEWASHTRNGYGVLSIGHSDKVYAHRLALALKIGRDLAQDEFACHTCDNRLCVNPAHLYVGDKDSNGRDVRERWNRRPAICRRGHEFTDENTYWHRRKSPKNGRWYDARTCRICRRLNNSKQIEVAA